jgi:hypothetical protein
VRVATMSVAARGPLAHRLCATATRRLWHALGQPGAQLAARRGMRGEVASREWHEGVFGSRRSRRAGWRHTLGQPVAQPFPPTRQAGTVASRERHKGVTGLRRSRRAGSGTLLGRPEHSPLRTRQARRKGVLGSQ